MMGVTDIARKIQPLHFHRQKFCGTLPQYIFCLKIRVIVLLELSRYILELQQNYSNCLKLYKLSIRTLLKQTEWSIMLASLYMIMYFKKVYKFDLKDPHRLISPVLMLDVNIFPLIHLVNFC